MKVVEGFHRSEENQNDVDIDRLLSEDITICKQFEQALNEELKEIRDVKHNLEVIKDQMKSLRKLHDERNKILDGLKYDFLSPQGMDIGKTEKAIRMLNRIDRELKPMLNRLHDESLRLQLDETHKLYASQKTIMESIDGESRKIHVELISLNDNITAGDNRLEEIKNKLMRIKQERSNRGRPVDRIGFK